MVYYDYHLSPIRDWLEPEGETFYTEFCNEHTDCIRWKIEWWQHVSRGTYRLKNPIDLKRGVELRKLVSITVSTYRKTDPWTILIVDEGYIKIVADGVEKATIPKNQLKWSNNWYTNTIQLNLDLSEHKYLDVRIFNRLHCVAGSCEDHIAKIILRFEAVLPTPTPTPPTPTYVTLTISASEGGTTQPRPGIYLYPKGSTVTITAIPYSDYSFEYWDINGRKYYNNPISILLEADARVYASFKQVFPTPTKTPSPTPIPITPTPSPPTPSPTPTYPSPTPTYPSPTPITPTPITPTPITPSPTPTHVTLTISASEGGTTQPSPGMYRYPFGSTVTITAIPYSNYTFEHWNINGEIHRTNPISIYLNTDVSAYAKFKHIPPSIPIEQNWIWILVLSIIGTIVGVGLVRTIRR